jgi:tetratricopeptide (TPR) repeat protein
MANSNQNFRSSDPGRDTIIIEVAPSIFRTDLSMTDQDNLFRALQHLANGRLDEARIYLEELLHQDPDNPDLLYNLGLCYVDLGQLDRGIELLNRCLELAPRHSHAFVALGIAYQKKDDLAQAREATSRALAIDPKNPVALNDPKETHVLRSLPGRTFSALELLCIMYAGFKRIEPGIDIGVDLGEEWEMAERLGRETEEE